MSSCRCALAGVFLIAGTVLAHPHKDIDQQVFVSVGIDVVTIQVRIAPSYVDGAAIFAHIDGDGDGVVSDAEAATFAAAVVAKSALTINDTRVEFTDPRASVPTIEWVSAGFGVIEVEASAAVNLTRASPHRVAFEISYDDLAHDWFLQPFFYSDLIDAMSSHSLERSLAGNRVEILISS